MGIWFYSGFVAFISHASEHFSPLIITSSLLAIIYGCLTSYTQVDLKHAISYSSVAHMLLTASAFLVI